MRSPWLRLLLLATVLPVVVAACSESPTVDDVGPIDLQVRNSGMPGGYLWLSVTGDRSQGRWHQFGMAEFLCVTCPVPYDGSGPEYEIAVLDESCVVEGVLQAGAGQWLVEIDFGRPTLVEAPPLGDWMPGDSVPATAASVPCLPP